MAMADEVRNSGSSGSGGTNTINEWQVVRAADTGLTVVVKWIHLAISGVIALTLFGVTIGTILQKSSQQEEAQKAIQVQLHDISGKVEASATSTTELKLIVGAQGREIDQLKSEQATARDMFWAKSSQMGDRITSLEAQRKAQR